MGLAAAAIIGGLASAGAGIYGAKKASDAAKDVPTTGQSLYEQMRFRGWYGDRSNSLDARDAMFQMGLEDRLNQARLFGSQGGTMAMEYLARDYKGNPVGMRTQNVAMPQMEGALSRAARMQPQLAALQRSDLMSQLGMATDLAPQLRQIGMAYDPERERLSNSLMATAQSGLGSWGGGDALADRDAQQAIRAGQAARGMGFGRSDLYEEAIGLDRSRQQRRSIEQTMQLQRGDFAQRVLAQRAALMPDPINVLLNRASNYNTSSLMQQAGMQNVPNSMQAMLATNNWAQNDLNRFQTSSSLQNMANNNLTGSLGGLGSSAALMYAAGKTNK